MSRQSFSDYSDHFNLNLSSLTRYIDMNIYNTFCRIDLSEVHPCSSRLNLEHIHSNKYHYRQYTYRQENKHQWKVVMLNCFKKVVFLFIFIFSFQMMPMHPWILGSVWKEYVGMTFVGEYHSHTLHIW